MMNSRIQALRIGIATVALVVLVGCNDRWYEYADAFVELQHRRNSAEEMARSIKATFSPADTAYTSCRSLYEAARRENQYDYLALAAGLAGSKPLTATQYGRSPANSVNLFLTTGQRHLANRKATTDERGVISSALRLVVKPITSIAKPEGKPNLEQVLQQVRSAVLWVPWESVV